MLLANLFSRVNYAVNSFQFESRVLGTGRTLIALAQASVLIFTPANALFVPVGGHEVRIDCAGIQQVSGYCLIQGADRQWVSWALLVSLVVVASGVLPRCTGVLHYWVSLSIHTSISLPDGGETVAQVCTFFLMLACLGDGRRWHWQRPSEATDPPKQTVLHGMAWAGHWGLRLQVAYIYLNSALAKLAVPQWQDGTATYYVSRMESFGATGILSALILTITSIPLIALITSWGTILTEMTIAVLVLRTRQAPLVALSLSAALHTMIGLVLGIVSFAMIMVGVVVCATAPALSEFIRRQRRTSIVPGGDFIGEGGEPVDKVGANQFV